MEGEFARIGFVRPEEDGQTDDNTIRAAFIRYLALGGCAACTPHEKGVQLWGAWISGPLDLESCRGLATLNLNNSWFDSPITLMDTEGRRVNLSGSRLAGTDSDGDCLIADRLKTTGGVFLRNGFQADGEVRLLGAEIGGDLSCIAGRFENPNGDALDASNLKTTGNVFLQNGFHASGAVRLVGAKIGGQLSCIAGRFENPNGDALDASNLKTTGDVFLRNGFHASGAVRLLGAEIGGQLSCIAGRFENPNGDALTLDGAKVEGAFFMRSPPQEGGNRLQMFDGRLVLTNAHVGSLVDAEECWPRPRNGAGRLYLGRFTYDRISETSPTGWRARKDWLELQPKERLEARDFRPQPWEQLERVLTAQGKVYDAKKIGEAKEGRLTPTLHRAVRPFHRLHGLVAGYGYFTDRAAWYSAILILISMVVFFVAWREGVMVPAHEVLLDAEEWQSLARSSGIENPAAAWIKQPPGSDYVSYNSFLYAFDVFIPIVTIEQEPAWTPSAARGRALFTLLGEE